MSDNTTTGGETGDKPFEPITSQDALNKVIGERVARAETKGRTEAEARFSDYDEIQTELDGFRSLAADADDSGTDALLRQVTELTEKTTTLESDLSNSRVEALREKAARAHGITDDAQVEMYLTGKTAEALTAQAKGLAELIAAGSKHGTYVAREGTTAPIGGGSDREFVRTLFASGD